MAALRESEQRSVLVAMVLALGMLTIDATIVRVALPAIQRDLDLSDVAQQVARRHATARRLAA
ncbi:hypothetical protein LRS13_17030 [Svornostia abyssi]|uniref:MFS transporter n=1 Tax=Svornostia abyssi TaxID=2898438 RepID=A0ABY5PCN1_9ACTN|nr:hypothetical protein LRS13_17030 [Parviterribacteraceae bacterium J379]